MTTTFTAPHAAGRSSLLGYAVLRANYSSCAPAYLDNFTPFVLDVLRDAYPNPQEEGQVGAEVRERFGLTIPDRVVGSLLKRSIRNGQVERIGRETFVIAEAARGAASSLSASMVTFLAQQNELMTRFRDFVEEVHPQRLGLIEEDPALHMHAFIERFAAPLLRRAISAKVADRSWSDLQGADYLVAAFILRLADTDARIFGYVVDAVKGAILTGVLDIGPGDLRQSLQDLTLIFDTPLLLSALGYQGAAPKRAMHQLLDLGRVLGVRLALFEHTEQEIAGALDAASNAITRPGRVQMRPMDLHFLANGVTPADIAVMQDRLRQNLEALGLRVISRPDSHYRYGLDEQELEACLQDRLPTQAEVSRRFDVDSISALHRLRQGGSPDKFERCRFVFVTSNSRLSAAARSITTERHRWPLVMLDNEVAGLLWVRRPAAAEDLPREQLLAAVHAGMQPDGHLWMKYVEEIEKLEALGAVDPSEALVLRSAPEARRALMDVTLGDASLADDESFGEVVARVRASLAEPFRTDKEDAVRARDAAAAEAAGARAELERLNSESINAERERVQRVEHMRSGFTKEITDMRHLVNELEQQGRVQRDRIRARSVTSARRRLTSAIVIPACALSCAGVAQLVAPTWVATLPTWFGVVALLAGAVALILTLVRSSVGGDLRSWMGPVESRWACRIERRELARAGLAEEFVSSANSHLSLPSDSNLGGDGVSRVGVER